MYNKLESDIKDISWFNILILFMLVDMARIHQIVPGLSVLKPGAILSLLLVIKLINSHRLTVCNIPQVKFIICFFCLLCLYVPFATNGHFAYLIAKDSLLGLPFLLSCVILINSKRRMLSFVKAIVFVLMFVACFGLLHGGHGPGGTIVDENDLALFLVSYLPLLFFLLSQEKKLFVKILLCLVVTIVLLAIVITFSRGGFLGLVGMSGVYFFFSKRKVLLVILACFFIVIILRFGGDVYVDEMSTVTDTNESTASERLLSWQAGWKMFIDKPYGVGPGNFPIHFPDYQPEQMTRNMWGRQAHSLWFTLIPETGVLGIVIYLAICVRNVKDLFQIKKFTSLHSCSDCSFFESLVVSLCACFAGFFVTASFLSVLYYPIFWLLSILVACAVLISEESIQFRSQTRSM